MRDVRVRASATALIATLLIVCQSALAADITIGDRLLQFRLSWDSGELTETLTQIDGQPISAAPGKSWSVRVDAQQPQASGDAIRLQANVTERNAVFAGENDRLSWKTVYSVTGPGRITKALTLTSKREQRLEEVTLWDAALAPSPHVARTGLQDIAAFYRVGERGLFVSLDFPYSDIAVEGDRTRISFPPWVSLKAGETFECHTLTCGATRLAGRQRYGYDEGEVDAMDRYVQERFPPRFERPMILSCSINNRYTQVREGVIFYTMKDHPTLRDNTELLERELALMPRLGVEYYQVFPGVFDWALEDPRPFEVKRLMQVAARHGIRMGDYSGASSVFCPHYNEHGNHLDRPEWLITGPDGKPSGAFCFGCPAFVKYYINTVVPNCRAYGFELHCLDFLAMATCHAENHGHPAGRKGVYQQVRGLVRLLEAINAVSPQMMTWSNSGNWAELLPKIAWSNPNLYLTDPFIATPWQGLNMTRLLDDARREQMVSLHHTHFVPYRFLTNCQYFFSQNSIVPDIRNYEYGALSTLAVTPNLCLGEIRPWIDRLSAHDQDKVAAFYTHWTRFVREHFALWKRTFQAGENPGPGAVEIYAHAAGSRGFIFLVNPQYWDRTVDVPLDSRLGFAGDALCEVGELYPVERLHLTPEGTSIQLGSRLPVNVPAQSVIVLEVRPSTPITAPRLYGLPGSIEPTGSGHLVRTHGPQGATERFAIAVPTAASRPTGATVRSDVPYRPARYRDPTPLRVLGGDASSLLLEITFRRATAPTELRSWRARGGSASEGVQAGWHKGSFDGTFLQFPLFIDVAEPALSLPLDETQADRLKLGPLANFCGAFVENAFSEQQETWIDVTTSGDVRPAATQVALDAPIPAEKPLPAVARDQRSEWWLATTFHLPFNYTIGAEPFFDEHTFIVFPLLRAGRVKSLQAWINGSPLDVQLYRYPRNRALSCRYADLVGFGATAGTNTLVVHLAY